MRDPRQANIRILSSPQRFCRDRELGGPSKSGVQTTEPTKYVYDRDILQRRGNCNGPADHPDERHDFRASR